MNPALRHLAVAAGGYCPIPTALLPQSPVVLMYHGISVRSDTYGMNARSFEQQIAFLKQRFNVVSPHALQARPSRNRQIDVVLTFDDGFQNNAEVVVPLLRRHRMPAVFFVSSRHATPGRYLWFAYLRMLARYFPFDAFTFRGESMNMRGGRLDTIRRLENVLLSLKPHPSAMYDAIRDELPPLADFVPAAELRDFAAGMTVEQLQEISADPLFTIGGHTVDHPLLTRCDPAEAARQITDNKRWIERVCNTTCDMFAYPGSDYDAAVLNYCREAGFRHAHSESRRIASDPLFEIRRIGVYYPSVAELAVKVRWSAVIGDVRQRQARRASLRQSNLKH